MNASQLVSYDFFKDLLVTQNILSDGMPLHLVSSATAGTVATTICAPADVVKSRVMNAKPGGLGPVALLAENFKREGPRFLFRGWFPAWSESSFPSKLGLDEVAGAGADGQFDSRLIPSACSSSSNNSGKPSTSSAPDRSFQRLYECLCLSVQEY
jgi:hypothetical protein